MLRMRACFVASSSSVGMPAPARHASGAADVLGEEIAVTF